MMVGKTVIQALMLLLVVFVPGCDVTGGVSDAVREANVTLRDLRVIVDQALGVTMPRELAAFRTKGDDLVDKLDRVADRSAKQLKGVIAVDLRNTLSYAVMEGEDAFKHNIDYFEKKIHDNLLGLKFAIEKAEARLQEAERTGNGRMIQDILQDLGQFRPDPAPYVESFHPGAFRAHWDGNNNYVIEGDHIVSVRGSDFDSGELSVAIVGVNGRSRYIPRKAITQFSKFRFNVDMRKVGLRPTDWKLVAKVGETRQRRELLLDLRVEAPPPSTPPPKKEPPPEVYEYVRIVVHTMDDDKDKGDWVEFEVSANGETIFKAKSGTERWADRDGDNGGNPRIFEGKLSRGIPVGAGGGKIFIVKRPSRDGWEFRFRVFATTNRGNQRELGTWPVERLHRERQTREGTFNWPSIP